MRATLWIGTNDGDLQFLLEEAEWKRVEAQIERIIRSGGTGFLQIPEDRGSYNLLVNQGTQLRWRVTD